MIALQFEAEIEFNNSKCLVLRATASGTYGVAGAGDLLNLAPYELTGNPNGVTDPKNAYNNILGSPPTVLGILNPNIAGYTCNLKPNATPSMTNLGLQFYSAGTEFTTAEAYPAPVSGGYVDIIVGLTTQ